MKRRIRKVHLDREAAGESTAYWEQEWATIDRAAHLDQQLAHPDATLRLLQQLVPERGVVLEAGSGASTYLAALRAPGRTLLGVDRAGVALRQSAAVWPDLALVDGDVRSMPLRDASVDCVISLGVVEHLEAGPLETLREHRRVLRPDGIGLISVPTVSGVRWAKDRWNIDLMRRDSYVARRRIVTTVADTVVEDGPGRFHQYEFDAHTWHGLLRRSGFEVVEDHRHLVTAGIGEVTIPGRSRRSGSSDPSSAGTAESSGSEVSRPVAASGAAPRRGDGVRRVVLAELPENPVERLVCRWSQRMLGHMILTVVRPG